MAITKARNDTRCMRLTIDWQEGDGSLTVWKTSHGSRVYLG
jgi:hypothetical protein